MRIYTYGDREGIYCHYHKVVVRLDDGQEFRMIEKNGGLYISIDGQLSLEPGASNAVTVKSVDDFVGLDHRALLDTQQNALDVGVQRC